MGEWLIFYLYEAFLERLKGFASTFIPSHYPVTEEQRENEKQLQRMIHEAVVKLRKSLQTETPVLCERTMLEVWELESN